MPVEVVISKHRGVRDSFQPKSKKDAYFMAAKR